MCPTYRKEGGDPILGEVELSPVGQKSHLHRIKKKISTPGPHEKLFKGTVSRD
jgi:hypothetical protein